MATINGTTGPDNLGPLPTADVYFGMEGNDTINAGTRPAVDGGPADYVVGGDDTDLLVVDASAEVQMVSLDVAGNPRFLVRSLSGNFYVDADASVELVSFTGGSGDDSINTGSYGVAVNGGAGLDFWASDLVAATGNIFFQLGTTTSIAAAGLTSITGIERINMRTGSGNDTIIGGSQADTINGSAGDDLIDAKTRPSAAGADIDYVVGGDGTDTLMVDASAETQSVSLDVAGNPRFLVRSDSGNFYLDADASVEKVRFIGGSGDDDINTNSFGQVVKGGLGIDHWTANLSAVGANIFYNMATTHKIAAAGLNAIYGIDGITLITGSGNDTVISGSQADTISTGDGNDLINAGRRPAIDGGPIDYVSGGAGDDTLVVNASSDTQGVSLTVAGNPHFLVRSVSGQFYLDADAGVERVRFIGGSGDDTINGASENDTLKGGGGADSIVGGDGKDTLFGGNANDVLNGNGGNDKLFGGAGDDTMRGFAGNDLLNGGGGSDVLDGDGGRDTLVGKAGADQLDGGNGNDVLKGNGGGDVLNGGARADKLFGGGKNDVLNGNGGADTLNGQNGADTLNGGGGDDVLNGGGGNDRFEFGNGFGHDTLFGFSAANQEKIDFSAVTAIVGFPDLVNHHLHAQAGTGYAMIVVGSNSLVLDGVQASDVGPGLDYSAQDFLF